VTSSQIGSFRIQPNPSASAQSEVS